MKCTFPSLFPVPKYYLLPSCSLIILWHTHSNPSSCRELGWNLAGSQHWCILEWDVDRTGKRGAGCVSFILVSRSFQRAVWQKGMLLWMAFMKPMVCPFHECSYLCWHHVMCRSIGEGATLIPRYVCLLLFDPFSFLLKPFCTHRLPLSIWKNYYLKKEWCLQEMCDGRASVCFWKQQNEVSCLYLHPRVLAYGEEAEGFR